MDGPATVGMDDSSPLTVQEWCTRTGEFYTLNKMATSIAAAFGNEVGQDDGLLDAIRSGMAIRMLDAQLKSEDKKLDGLRLICFTEACEGLRQFSMANADWEKKLKAQPPQVTPLVSVTRESARVV